MSALGYADLGDLDEDSRIEIIGRAVMEQRKTVAVVTDADLGKADRYIAKLKAKFPEIVVVARFKGPVKDTVTIKVGPPLLPSNN
jgi:hypothetical protein